jgi:murein DD-endopeptidase MepM/ murein hydrolase activator NlpD
MARLLLFVFGLLLGGAGISFLYEQGFLQAGVAASAPTTSAPASVPASNGVELPALPSAPAGVAPPAPALVTENLPPPAGESVAPTAGSTEAEAAPTPEAAAALVAAQALAGAQLLLPVQGITATQLVDTYTQARGEGRLHDAIDIMAPRGTPVLAVADGRVAKLFTSVRGGLTVYQFDREEKIAYYYAHLDRYAPGVAEGVVLKRGDPIGFVGSTGNASPDGPHLHFAVFVLGPEKHWWQGTAVNPYPLLGGR